MARPCGTPNHFNFRVWSRQALGLPGLLPGWTPTLRRRVSETALSGLRAFHSSAAISGPYIRRAEPSSRTLRARAETGSPITGYLLALAGSPRPASTVTSDRVCTVSGSVASSPVS